MRVYPLYCRSSNIPKVFIFTNFVRKTNSRIQASRENYYYISATKEKWKSANSKLREKSQNKKFAKIWTPENYQIYSIPSEWGDLQSYEKGHCHFSNKLKGQRETCCSSINIWLKLIEMFALTLAVYYTVVKIRSRLSSLAFHTSCDVMTALQELIPFEADPLTAEHHSNTWLLNPSEVSYFE